MTDKPIPTTFVEPNPYQDWHDAEPVQHDRAEFRHADGSPSQIPALVEPDAPERDAEAEAATPAPAPTPDAPTAQDGPQPVAAGTYAIYEDGSGGFVFVIGTREGETLHKHFPARMVKMAEMAMGGNSPLSALLGI